MASTATCEKCASSILRAGEPRFCAACLLEQVLIFRDDLLDEADAPTAPLPRRTFGDYQLLGELGRGGMGVVYRAQQQSLRREVALKLVTNGAFASEETIRRFESEAAVAARLDHPNIVQIHEIGDCDGQPYFSMRLVEGQPLHAKLSGQPLPPSEAVRLLARVARAVHYAHQHGVLHRDLKPANILIDREGVPHLTDFGLAKLLDGQNTLTQSNAILGTPSYISPEQARGDLNRVTTASDVYGLGAVLYEMLAGAPPFAGRTTLETVRQVLATEPKPPSLANPQIDRDLDTICLKCLEKDPARRYGSALALAEDLERWMRRDPILARRASAWERCGKLVQRRPLLAALVVALACSLIAGVSGIFFEWRRAERERFRAEQQNLVTRRNLYAVDMYLAQRALAENNFGLARAALEEHWPAPGEEDLRGFEWRYLWEQSRGDQEHTFFCSNLVSSVAFSPQGGMLAAGSWDGTVRVWSASTFTDVASLKADSRSIYSVSFSPDGRLLATGGAAGFVRLWGADNWQMRAEYRGRQTRAVFIPHSRQIAIGENGNLWGFSGGGTKLFSWPELAEEKTLGSGGHAAVSQDGKTLATGVSDDQVFFWDRETGKVLGQKTNVTRVLAMTFSLDGKTLFANQREKFEIELWSVPDGRTVAALAGHSGKVHSIALSPDGQLLASASADQTIKIWDTVNRKEVRTLRGHANEAMSVVFSPDGKTLASGGKDGTVRLWSLEPPERTGLWTNIFFNLGFGNPVFSPSGAKLATATRDQQLIVWDTAAEKASSSLASREFPLAFSPDEKTLVTAAYPNALKTWDIATGLNLSRIFLGQRYSAETQARLAPGGGLIAVGGSDGSVYLCDTRSGEVLGTLDGHGGLLLDIVFSGDGKTLAASGQNNLAKVWDVPTRSELATLRGHNDVVRALALSPDGTLVATASLDNTARVFEVRTGKHLATLAGQKNYLTPVSQFGSVESYK